MRHSTPLPCLLLSAMLAASEAPQVWSRTSDFVASQLQAWQDQAVAGDGRRVAQSRDGGRSWSTALIPEGSADTGVLQIAAWSGGVAILLGDGRLLPAGPRCSRLAVDGAGGLWAETAEGAIVALTPAPGPALTQGTLINALGRGVLLRTATGALASASADGVKTLRGTGDAQAAIGPATFLASGTGGGDVLPTASGQQWRIRDGSLVLEGSRPMELRSWWMAGGLMQEHVAYQGQVMIFSDQNGGVVDRRSEGLPVQATRLTSGVTTYIAAAADGLWVVAR